MTVAGNLKPGDAYSLLKLGLLDPGDLGWILRELPGLPMPAQDTIARCVSLLALHPQAGEADLILAMDTVHPAYPYIGGLRQTLTDAPMSCQGIRVAFSWSHFRGSEGW